MKHESFDEWMRQKAGAHEAPVPADAWEKITGRKKKRRRFLIWWWIPLAAGIMVLGYGTWRYTGITRANKQIAAADKENNDRQKAGTTGLQDKPAVTVNQQQATLEKQAAQTSDNDHSESDIATAVSGEFAKGKKAGKRTVQKKALNPIESYKTTEPAIIVKEPLKETTDAAEKAQTALPPEDKGNNSDTVSIQKMPGERIGQDVATINTPEAAVIKEWTIDSVYLQPENLAAAVAAKRRQTYFAELYVSPFLPFQQVTKNKVSRVQETPLMKQEFVSSRIHSKPQMGWSGGINVGKQLNARWQLMTGVQYSTFSEKISMEGREVITHYNIVQRMVSQPGGPVLVNDTVESYEYGTRQIAALNRYQTWSIPLMAGYRLMDKRGVSLQLQGGAVVHIARRYQNNIVGEFNTDDAGKRSSAAVAQGLDLHAGMRLMLHPRSRLRVFAEPAIRYSIMPTQTSDMLERKRLHQFGLSLGLQYGL